MIPSYADLENRRNALATAEMLLDSGCVRFDTTTPFAAASGLESPLHVDIRRLLGYPDRRQRLLRLALDEIETEIQPRSLDAIACPTEGPGVAIATLLADRLCLPLLFVRRCPSCDPHKHDVEGRLDPGWRVLLVEQLATDGQRKAALVNTLNAAGAVVTDLFVVFQYGVYDAIHEHLAPLGVRTHALASWWDILEVVAANPQLPPEALGSIRTFLHDPSSWHRPPIPGRVPA